MPFTKHGAGFDLVYQLYRFRARHKRDSPILAVYY